MPGVTSQNCGVPGERTDQIAARLPACARGADALIVQGGINDIAQGRRALAAADELRAMVRRGKALGLRVGLADVLPWNNGHPRFTTATELKLAPWGHGVNPGTFSAVNTPPLDGCIGRG